MPVLYFVFPAILAGLVSVFLTPLMTPLAVRIGAIDLPGPRKLHTRPIPRIGGVAVVVGAIVAWDVLLLVPEFEQTFPPDLALGMTAGLLPVFAVSLLDDARSVRPTTRLLVQCLSAAIAIAFGVRLYPDVHLFGSTVHIGLFAIPLTMLWIVGVTNAFNLADGLDGLSAGLALISAASFSALGLVIAGPKLAALPLVLVGALLGFLPFNVYPARVFLGDCGAASIGFCLACLGVRSNAALSSGLAILVPVLVVGVPVVDTALAIARRTVRRVRQSGAGIFTADRDHIHHRLIATGLNHPRAVLVLYAIAATTAGVAIGSVFVTERNAALLLVTLVAAAFIGIGRLRYDEFAVLRGGALLQIYDAPVLRLSIFPVFVDIAFVVLSLWIAIGLKFDDWRVVTSRPLALNLLTVLTASAVLAFAVRGLYRGSWRQVGVEDLIRTTSAVAVAVSIGAVAAQLMVPSAAPLSLFGIYGMVLLLLVTGARSSFRLLLHLRQRDVLEGDAVLIYGAGAGGSLALRELLNNRDHRVRPVGFIDDDPRRTGRLLNGYPILGSIESLDRLLRTERARGVVFASSKIPPERVAKARAICARHDVRVLKFSASLSVVHQAELPRKVLVHAKLPAS